MAARAVQAERPLDSGHIRALDGIRGFAVALVFAYHAFAYLNPSSSAVLNVGRAVFAAGWSGVDVFFVLSGFLITTILLDARQASNYFKVFYGRRALRITPLYYLIVAGSLLLEPGHASLRAQPWYWLNLSNIPTAFVPLLIPYLAHLWSLAIEEQFYLVWPSLVRWFSVRTTAIVCGVTIVSVWLARNLPVVLRMNERYPEFVYRLTPFRLDTLSSGALLAIIVMYRPSWVQSRALLRAAFVLGLALFVLSGGHYTKAPVVRYGYCGLTIASCALIALALFPHSSVARIFSNSFARKLGKYSYAFYLFHPYIVNLAAQRASGVGRRIHRLSGATLSSNEVLLLLLPFEFAIVFGLSAVSWQVLEGPLLRFKRHLRYTPRPEHYLA